MAKKPVVETTTETEETTEEIKTVKVYKKGNDPMTHFCGATVEIDEDGREFFTLGADLKEMVDGNPNLIWPTEN